MGEKGAKNRLDPLRSNELEACPRYVKHAAVAEKGLNHSPVPAVMIPTNNEKVIELGFDEKVLFTALHPF